MSSHQEITVKQDKTLNAERYNELIICQGLRGRAAMSLLKSLLGCVGYMTYDCIGHYRGGFKHTTFKVKIKSLIS